ncbi:MAG: hypothetical protein NZ839_04290 [Endomicrobia bacterium]|nr:hypothetical protein [Endomicrobiia bacterium]
MKKLIILLCLISLCLLSSCYTVRVLSDTDRPITLASKTDVLPFKETYRVWYALWGLVPISDNTTNKILRETKIRKVRVTAKMTIVDYLISLVLNAIIPTTIATWTIEVEGAE